jgi:ribosome-associated toxin RatA of RatAB toxin-antitoxin module
MKSSILALAILMLLVPGYSNAEDQWTLKKDSDGVKVYSTPSAGEDLIVYKGVTEINAPIEVVTEVVRDIPSYTQWYWQCKEARILKSDQGKRTIVFYFVTHPGWPVSDRDFIVYNTQVGDPKSGEVSFALGNITEDIVPLQEGIVRLKHVSGGWNLKKIDKNKTAVTLLIKTEPGGSVPKAVANMVMGDTPFNTLKELKRMATIDKYYKLAGIPKNQ